jgi:hypothetical protein
VAAEIVMLDPPEFVSVTVFGVLLPVCTVPKLTLAGLEVRLPAVTTVAERGIFNVALLALLVMATFPLAVPADCAASFTLKVAVPPAATVTGRVMPVRL